MHLRRRAFGQDLDPHCVDSGGDSVQTIERRGDRAVASHQVSFVIPMPLPGNATIEQAARAQSGTWKLRGDRWNENRGVVEQVWESARQTSKGQNYKLSVIFDGPALDALLPSRPGVRATVNPMGRTVELRPGHLTIRVYKRHVSNEVCLDGFPQEGLDIELDYNEESWERLVSASFDMSASERL